MSSITREVPVDSNDIVHIVSEGEGINALYLRDGRIARISTVSGKLMTVVKLPSDVQLQEAERRSTSRRSRAVISGSHYDVD
jgi:hypothetical protein